MSGKLVHVPFDKGIDENAETAGALQTTALARCTNLWHAKAGALYPRPGTAERAITVDNAGPVNLIGNAAGSNLVMVDGTLYVDQDGTGIDAGRVMPFGGRDMWALANGMGSTTWAYVGGQHAIAFEPTDAAGTYIQIYNDATHALVRSYTDIITSCRSMLDVGGVPAMYASHASDTDGIYLWDLEAFTSALAATAAHPIVDILATSDGTDIYVYVKHGPIGTNNTSQVFHADYATPGTLTAIETFGSSPSANPQYRRDMCMVNGTLILAYEDDSADLVVRTYAAGALVGTSTPITADIVDQIYVVPAEDGIPGAWVINATTITAANDTWKLRVDTNGAVQEAASVLIEETIAVGGGFAANGTSYVWAITNWDASQPFLATVLLDIQTGAVCARLPQSVSGLQVAQNNGARQSALVDGAWKVLLPVSGILQSPENYTPIHSIVEIQSISDGNGAESSTRQILQFGGSAYIPGDQLMSWSGGRLFESLSMHAPYIESATPSNSTGSLTPSSTYQYQFVFSYLDEIGIDHIGPASNAVDVTMSASDDTVTLNYIRPAALGDQGSGPAGNGFDLLIYRTQANGTTLHLVDRFPIGATTFQYIDTTPDSDIEDNPVLYTVSGELSHDPAPPSRFGCVGKLRMWLAGQYNLFRVSFSMESLRGEVPAFPDFPGYALDFDAEVTGLASIDDTVAVFTERETYLVTGDGPDRIGNGSFQVRPIGVGVGCSDWRSVASSPIGIFFAGNQTIWLLPRGFAAPVNIGSMIAETLRQYPVVISAVLADYGDQQLMHFLLKTTGDYTGGAIQVEGETIQIDGDDYIQISESESRHMVYSLGTQQWYRWANDDYAPLVAGLMRRPQEDSGTEQLVYASALTGAGETVTTREEQFWQPFDIVGEDSALPAVEIQTHQWHPWGLTGDAAVDRVWWRVRVDEEQSAWSLTEVSVGESHAPLTIVPANRAGWQNIEFRMPWARVPELGLTLSARSAAFAGLTYEVTTEGFAKERTAQRTG